MNSPARPQLPLGEWRDCERECERLRAQLDKAAETVARQNEIIEHLKRSLWLAEHPEHAKREEPTP